MSSSVIASRHRQFLAAVLPWTSRALDVEAVRAVLARHGLALVDSDSLATANELLVGEDLDPVDAEALAADLREAGLHARVVHRSGLTGSRRMANAFAATLLTGVAGFGGTMLALIPVIDAAKDAAAIPAASYVGLAAGLAVLGAAVLNGLATQRGGGTRLQLAGRVRSADERRVTDELAELVAGLPDHVARPLLDRARRLEVHARQDPDGEAAAALRTLVDDLRRGADAEAAEEVEALRDEVDAARRALAEARSKARS